MKARLSSAATALALAAAPSVAQEAEIPVDELVGQPVYALGDASLLERPMTEMHESATVVGVVEGRSPGGSAVRLALSEVLAADFGAMADIPAGELRLIPDADDDGDLFLVLASEDAALRDMLTDAREAELLQDSLAEEDVAEQSAEMTTSPVAEGTDGLDEEGRPIDAAEAEPADAEVIVVEPQVVEVEPETTDVMPAEEEVVDVEPREAEEGTRVVDITGPDQPPIEDAEDVVPEQELLQAETGLTSPTHTAPTQGEQADLAAVETDASETGIALPNAPEGFSAADMSTMDPTQLLGVRVYTMDDEQVGEIDRWIGEAAPGRLPEGAVVELGGFLGIAEREVGVETGLLTLLTDEDGNGLRVYLDMTEEQIEALPEVE